MLIRLVRHPQTQANITKILCGWINSPVSDKGKQASKDCINTLIAQKLVPDEIWSSSLMRAHDMAKLYAEELLHKKRIYRVALVNTSLNEHNTGLLSNMKKDRFVALYGPEYHNSFLFFKVRFPLGGESMEDVYIRSSTWLKLMMPLWHARYGQDASIIIFSHNGVMRCLYKYISTLQGYQFHTDNDYWLSGFKNCESIDIHLDYINHLVSIGANI